MKWLIGILAIIIIGLLSWWFDAGEPVDPMAPLASNEAPISLATTTEEGISIEPDGVAGEVMPDSAPAVVAKEAPGLDVLDLYSASVQWPVYSMADVGLSLDLPPGFDILSNPDSGVTLSGQNLSLRELRYPEIGAVDWLLLFQGNVDLEDVDAVIREHAKETVQIFIGGVEAGSAVSSEAINIVDYQLLPDHQSSGVIQYRVDIKTVPTAANGRTAGVTVLVRTGDTQIGDQVKKMFDKIVESIVVR